MQTFQGLQDKEVKARYAREEFPLLDGPAASQAVWKCWNEVYDNAYDVVKELRGQQPGIEAKAVVIPDADTAVTLPIPGKCVEDLKGSVAKVQY